jgi:hypothetical protein
MRNEVAKLKKKRGKRANEEELCLPGVEKVR